MQPLSTGPLANFWSLSQDDVLKHLSCYKKGLTEAEAETRQLIAAGPGAAAYWRSQLRFGLAGNTVEPLIDGPAAFRAIQQAIESAENSDHFVYLLGWWTDPWVNLTGPGTCLLDLFERGINLVQYDCRDLF